MFSAPIVRLCGRSIHAAIGQLLADGTVTAGMVAKLQACEWAVAGGVEDVFIVDGRNRLALETAATDSSPANGTRVTGASLPQIP